MSVLGKIFKQKLDQRPFDFDEKYWNDLEKKLDAHNGKGGTNPLKWFSLSAVFVAVIISAILFLKPENKGEIVKIENNSSQITEKKFVSENLPMNKNSATQKKNFLRENEEKNLSEKEIVRKENPENNENKFSPQKREDAKKAKTFVLNSFEKISSGKIQKEISEDEKNEFPAEAIISQNSSSQKKVEENNFNNETADFHLLSSDFQLFLMNKIFLNEIQKIKNEELQTTTFKENIRRKKSNYFIGAYSGILYTDKILKSTDEKLSEYISRKKNEEAATFTKNFGIEFGIGQNCSNISIGLNYHEQGEILNYKPEFYQWLKNSNSSWNIADNSYWEIDTTNIISYTVANGSWQPVNVQVGGNTVTLNQYVTDTVYTQNIYLTDSNYVQNFDSAEIVKTDSIYQLVNDASSNPGKTTSKISYYEIPVLIGYEFPISRITLMFRTGFGVGMLSKVNAVYLKKDISGTEEISIERMNKTMLNYILRTSVLFYCTENIVLNFEPMFRTNLNSVFKNENFTQKYWNAGLNAGIIYRF